MSLAAGERAGLRFFQQRSFSGASSAPFFRVESTAFAGPSNWSPPRSFASNQSQIAATENGGEDILRASKMKEHPVDQALMRFLVGKGGTVKAQLERDNGVKLSIPSSNEARTRSSVLINGSESSIRAASIAIQKILDDAVQNKLQYTHFISLPLASHPALVEQVENFQKFSLGSGQSSRQDAESSSGRQEESDNIHKSIFIGPTKIHFTILMLKLWSEERVQAAADVLQKIKPFVHAALEHQPIVVDFQGVECLRGNPEKAHILYVEVPDSKTKARLLQTCQVLIDAFVESGLVLEKDIGQSLKLHVTLINTSHRKTNRNEWSSKRVPIDARHILAKYGNWNWGEYTISEAHLSQRFVYDKNGYYHCVNSIPFPTQAS